MDKLNPGARYDHEYFEVGQITGISGYVNYRWMPELTLRMAYHLIRQLPIAPNQRVLDFGCAKGFLVKALRILDLEAYGIDISHYAIEQCDGDVRPYCRLIESATDPDAFARDYHWMLAKDVFEHIPERELRVYLESAAERVKRLFAVIPLAADDVSGAFIVPDYNRDVTHVLARSFDWWTGFLESCGWTVERATLDMHGCKEQWTHRWPDGNGFFTAQSRSRT